MNDYSYTDRNPQSALLENSNNKRHHSNKAVKFILFLIVIGTFSYLYNSNSSISSLSSPFIQGSSGGGNRIGKVVVFNNRNNQQATRQQDEQAATATPSTTLLIHYHKTGNNFIGDLLTEIDRTYRQQRHDLAMKDYFVLNRILNKNGDGGGDDNNGTIDGTTNNMDNDNRKRRRMMTNEEDDQTKRLERRSKKQQAIKGAADTTIPIQKANKEIDGGIKQNHKASSVVYDQESDYYSSGRPKKRNKVRNRNKGQEALNQDQAKQKSWINVHIPQKRSHDPWTGCPNLGSDPLEIGAAYRMTAPDLFCNLSMLVLPIPEVNVPIEPPRRGSSEREVDLELDGIANSKEGSNNATRLPFPSWETTKIVHFVRDPFDMALSNYLYHSQRPTPEHWVLARHLNPCATSDEFIKFVLKELTGSSSSSRRDYSLPNVNITKDELLQVSKLCRYYRRDHPLPNTKPNVTRAFYGLLLRLPPYDGFRMATTHFLLAQHAASGGDLLRMPNNILRLKEWEEHGLISATTTGAKQSNKKQQSSHILTVSMGSIMKDMKGNIQEICDFIFGNISNATARSEIGNDIADAMVALYNAKEKASEELRRDGVGNNKSRNNGSKNAPEDSTHQTTVMLDDPTLTKMIQGIHLTQGLMDSNERRLLKERLEKDPVLGNIMLQLREIVDSVIERAGN
mmetsp:Transcript_45729/g.110824  ORF Transcript_45729/g.110824 Transcript_45729/m.110824 type:complete len:681 (-) Transcript_45729:143-2185(-)